MLSSRGGSEPTQRGDSPRDVGRAGDSQTGGACHGAYSFHLLVCVAAGVLLSLLAVVSASAVTL
jgi:hypothetical protein